MELKTLAHLGLLLSIFTSCSLPIALTLSSSRVQMYIVYLGDRLNADVSPTDVHTQMLDSVIMGRRTSEYLLYSYRKSFNGFVAKLTKEESEKLAGMDGVVSVFPNKNAELHTTKSWDFVGFPQEVKRIGVESDIIIGVLDTGIWPESEMFSDEGFGPPPSKFKGSCQVSNNFTCNNKIVGAKYFKICGDIPDSEIASPRDTNGHGSHTASIAAGRVVHKASLYGLGAGTARGGVPSARISVYKVCWENACQGADILAAFDEAISDGVDIISLSAGDPYQPNDYFKDAYAIGAFHSMKNGILTSNSAGNSGPNAGSVCNYSPWSLTVGANTIDRKYVAMVKLGNEKSYQGVAVNTFNLNGKMYPLVHARYLQSRKNSDIGSRDALYNGSIVLLDYFEYGRTALEVGAVGAIMQQNFQDQDDACSFVLPASVLSYSDGDNVSAYIDATSKPTATIDKSIEIDDKLAPYVVSFSSRGPNPITSDILKPDITAPGVEIIAAWSEATTVTGIRGDTRVVPYNILSGTSMSCPHATGAAAYVKSFNPTWSSSAIKSALMTTAKVLSPKSNSDAEFAYGSGQIDPIKAAKPGLIYDAGEADYISFLCGQGYSNKSLRLVTGDSTTSCPPSNNITVWDLNYPSFALSAKNNTSISRTFHRIVTNVGSPVSTYKAIIGGPSGLDIKVEPSVLSFKSLGQKQSFVVTVGATICKEIISGSLTWDDGVYKVRSPIVAFAT